MSLAYRPQLDLGRFQALLAAEQELKAREEGHLKVTNSMANRFLSQAEQHLGLRTPPDTKGNALHTKKCMLASS